FGFVGRAQHVRVGGVGFLGRHFVVEARLLHVLRHFGTTAQLIDEQLVEPGLVDLEVGVGEQAVPVETLDVVALVRAAVAPDVDAVCFHGGHEHGAGDGAPDGRGVEVRDAGGADVEGAGLQGRDAFGSQLGPAIDQAGVLGAVFHGAAGD